MTLNERLTTSNGNPWDFEGRNVLVTGGGGFIGSHLVEALRPETNVRVFDDFSNGNRDRIPSGVDVFEGDIRDDSALSEAMDGVDLVFHLAAIVSVQRSVESPTETRSTNVDATCRLLELARRNDVRVVFASSSAIYGPSDGTSLAEDAVTQPSSPYGLEKLTGDNYCRLYTQLYGLDTVALRYFNVYGPNQSNGPYSGVISTFISQAHAGGPITVNGNGTQTRDFVHVRDIVQANLLAATTEHVGTAFNIGTGRSIEIRTLAEIVRDAVDPTVDIRHVDERPGDVRHSCADVSKAHERLGYTPTIPLEDGIGDLVGR